MKILVVGNGARSHVRRRAVARDRRGGAPIRGDLSDGEVGRNEREGHDHRGRRQQVRSRDWSPAAQSAPLQNVIAIYRLRFGRSVTFGQR